ncbi:MAG: hypothetical protein M3Z66_19645 [Chloroflexota bacterium]|nr:hypothetical protein [Chloroflexota bacterium]
MAQLTRKGFLAKTSMGTAAIGAAMTVPGIIDAAPADAASELTLSERELGGPLVAHVRNLKTGEIALMVGTREIVYRDPQFVRRLVRAAHQESHVVGAPLQMPRRGN